MPSETGAIRPATGAPGSRRGGAPGSRRRAPWGLSLSGGIHGRQGLWGWLFVSPAVVGLVAFLVIPVLLALYVSFTNWDGFTNPLSGAVQWVGGANYHDLLAKPGLDRLNFMTAVRNNFYFVLFVVPSQTALALGLAVLVNNRLLKAKGFFRTAFYFPSVTSSIAITLVFIFLFQGQGAVNRLLSLVGIRGPNWLVDTDGVFHNVLGLLGVHDAPRWANHQVAGLSVWEWLSGPSVGMCVVIALVVWTTSGTFMLMFLAALQNIPEEVEEASHIDGAGPWKRLFYVTVPMLRPTLSLVVTLGLIGTWQVFDQITLVGKNNPTTITPAYYSYEISFQNQAFGVGAAVAFLLFLLIIVLNALQRRILREEVT